MPSQDRRTRAGERPQNLRAITTARLHIRESATREVRGGRPELSYHVASPNGREFAPGCAISSLSSSDERGASSDLADVTSVPKTTWRYRQAPNIQLRETRRNPS